MAGGSAEWGFPEACEGIQDAYETRQLQNGFLAGTAGSPYSRLDGTTVSMPLPHHRIPSPTEPYHDYNMSLTSAGGLNDGTFQSPNMPMAGYNTLRYVDFPDMSGLSMFSADTFQHTSGALHGLPIQNHGIFSAGLDNSNNAPVPSSSTFGSFSSVSNTSAPFGAGSFSSMSSGGGENDSSAILSPGHHDAISNASGNDLGMSGSFTSHPWPTATPDGTMSPKDIPLKRGPSPASLPDQAPPFLLFREDEEVPEQELDDEEHLRVTTPVREAPAPSRPSPSKKQRRSPEGATSRTKPRKSLPDKAPRSRKAQASQGQESTEKSPNAPRRAPQKEKAVPAKSAPVKKLKAKTTPMKPAQPQHILPSPVVSTIQHPFSRGFREPAIRDTDAGPANPEPAPKGKAKGPPRPSVPSVTIASSRADKDEFLLTSKKQGMTYREIRKAGHFTEAESTLRGRYRTLTKSKENRVRKPEWSEKDIQLLRAAVRKYGKATGENKGKLPWKLVAEYIHEKGGSYLFGNATCRKKWDELVAEKEKGKEEEKKAGE